MPPTSAISARRREPLGPEDAGKQYELALEIALAEVRVEFAFGSRGAPGEVKAGAPNECDEILASGDYTVLLDFGASGSRLERVTIRPREVTELRVRL